MTRAIATITLFLALPLVSRAQDVAIPIDSDLRKAPAADEMVVRHVTGWLAQLPEARAALEEFRARKAAGQLARARKHADDIGDREHFRVFNFAATRQDNIEFELVAIDDRDPPEYQVWVEVAELESDRVGQDLVDSLSLAMGHRTPSGSWNPGVGIIANDEEIFGEPPDVDGDGVTDVLVLDVRDGFNGTTERSFVAGFVSPLDLSSATGNGGDILYIDTAPSLRLLGTAFMESTAAHEYQHLIMFNWDLEEITFINEALSEWAEMVLGYPSRPIEYLQDVRQYNVPLFGYDSADSFGDRQRGQLFINYVAERFGVLNAGKITRSTLPGAPGLRNALINMQAGITLEELVFDFHMANGLNDREVDARYGYATPVRNGVKATPAPSINGRLDAETPRMRVEVQEGGVRYLQWDFVGDFSLTLHPVASDENPDLNSDHLRAEVVLFDESGNFASRRAVDITGDAAEFEGTFRRVLLVLVNADPTAGPRATDLAASWEQSSAPEETTVRVQYDNGSTRAGTIFSLAGRTEGKTATRFVNPEPSMDVQLDRVWLSHLYVKNFPPVDAAAPRDFALQVWGPDGAGRPGDVLFRREMTDTRPFARAALGLVHMEIDMAPFASVIGPLPDTMYIGIAEAGTDQNYQVITPSEYPSENLSFVYRSAQRDWQRLWDVQFVCNAEPCPPDDPIKGMVIPTRAQFVIRTITAAQDEQELPDGIWLGQNYPNPFNPTTSIAYRLQQAGPVRLAVFDLLGRRVSLLMDELQAAGSYVVTVDGTTWASGVYLYRLETESGTLTNRMLLVK